MGGVENKTRTLNAVFCVTIGIYAVTYVTYLDTTVWSVESEPFKFLYWFMTFLAGGLFRGYYEELLGLVTNRNITFGILSAILFVAFYIVKILLNKLHMMQFQFVIQLVELLFLFCFFVWMIGIEDKLKWFSEKKSWKIIDFLGSITLENYLFMDLIIAVFFANKVSFPINCILVFFTTFLLAGILHKIAGYIQKSLYNEYNGGLY